MEYEAALIKEQSPSELLRFTIHRLRTQLRNYRICHLPVQEEQLQKQVQNNQQQLHQFSSQPTTAAGFQQRQVPNTSQRKNFVSHKVTSCHPPNYYQHVQISHIIAIK